MASRRVSRARGCRHDAVRCRARRSLDMWAKSNGTRFVYAPRSGMRANCLEAQVRPRPRPIRFHSLDFHGQPGEIILSKDKKTRYMVKADGRWEKITDQYEGELSEVEANLVKNSILDGKI